MKESLQAPLDATPDKPPSKAVTETREKLTEIAKNKVSEGASELLAWLSKRVKEQFK